ncbi:reverse transcriptase domain-containing protein [Tanacetum coccineum]
MLRTFPFSLSEEAKTWLNILDEGTITSWNELREAFISRYFYPAKFRRLLNEIHSFHQLDGETLIDAWLRRILQQRNLDAEGIFLYNTPNEAFKILDDKVLLKLDFSDDSQINPKRKTVVSIGGSNADPESPMFREKFRKLSLQKSIPEFLENKEELEECETNIWNVEETMFQIFT